MNFKLSILICSLEKRYKQLGELVYSLPFYDEVEAVIEIDNGEMSTGAKRNKLLTRATGEYVCFIDDDDHITEDYLPEILKAIEQKPDVIGFEGWMTTNGTNRQDWKISKDLPYTDSKTQSGATVYLRFNNHLSPVKREIALKIGYPNKSHGEDYDYAVRLKQSGLIKTEVYIPKFLYHYDYKTKK